MQPLAQPRGGPRILLPLNVALAAVEEGKRRHIQAWQKRRDVRWNHPGGNVAWGDNIEGACAECAFASWLGVFWAPTMTTDKKCGDVCGMSVRGSGYETAHLAIEVERIAPERRHVLLLGSFDTWTIAGWITTTEGQRAEWYRTPDDGHHPPVRAPVYYVPQRALHTNLEVLREWNRPAKPAVAR